MPKFQNIKIVMLFRLRKTSTKISILQLEFVSYAEILYSIASKQSRSVIDSEDILKSISLEKFRKFQNEVYFRDENLNEVEVNGYGWTGEAFRWFVRNKNDEVTHSNGDSWRHRTMTSSRLDIQVARKRKGMERDEHGRIGN
ncbi:hypothetical protein LOAG_06618 [Loa loa]|uniref:Uncharacterized protein n=1 Tax=Loa loa TaxID=7209 RepID=A0A1S0TXT2_LOALO|nr:hypothetical protein LOAG_06618 [Loa loa]EFO21869.1 hypothetical protein LOAG_06618 [Loa loa]